MFLWISLQLELTKMLKAKQKNHYDRVTMHLTFQFYLTIPNIL